MKLDLGPWMAGFLFAVGLGLAGMTQPEKVIGFLDIFGQWNPTLIFVMLGAIGVHFFLYRIIRKRSAPLFSSQFFIPSKREINFKLIVGSLIFGVGWGLGGYCPAPAVTSLATLNMGSAIFVVSMLAGIFLAKWIDGRKRAQ